MIDFIFTPLGSVLAVVASGLAALGLALGAVYFIHRRTWRGRKGGIEQIQLCRDRIDPRIKPGDEFTLTRKQLDAATHEYDRMMRHGLMMEAVLKHEGDGHQGGGPSAVRVNAENMPKIQIGAYPLPPKPDTGAEEAQS